MNLPALLSVVVPCYRSADYIGRTVAELVHELEGWCPFEVVLVNDGSPDDLQEIILRLSREDGRVRYVELGTNRGQHFATMQGLGAARGDCVVTVDDDGQIPPSAVKAVSERLLEGGFDVVYGAFQTVKQTSARRLVSRANWWLTRLTLGNKSGLVVTNVRAIRGDLARALAAAAPAEPYIDALIWRATRRIGQVDVEHRARQDGRSTYSLWRLLKLWVTHLTLLTILPLQLASVGSLIVSLLGFLVGTIQLVHVLSERSAPPGWLSLFLTLTSLFSVLFLFLAVIATYVGRLYVEGNARGLAWVRSASDGARSTSGREGT